MSRSSVRAVPYGDQLCLVCSKHQGMARRTVQIIPAMDLDYEHWRDRIMFVCLPCARRIAREVAK